MNQHWQYRHQFYKELKEKTSLIYAEARDAADEIGIPEDLRGQIGLTPTISGNHGYLRGVVARAMEEASRKVSPCAYYDEQIREVVKSVYGDEYDAALTSTCEAGLYISFSTLCMPSIFGRGETYRGRYISLYEHVVQHQGGFGRPFPPKYKDIIAEQGETSGENGLQGKRLANLDTVFVKNAGAQYDCHGIKFMPTPLLYNTDVNQTLKSLEKAAARHADTLTGFTSLGYDTAAYGYGEKDTNGTPNLQKGIAGIASDYDVPYIVDNAWGAPFIGADPRKLGCDVMVFSMDKVTGSPTCGLIIGKEEALVQIRRSLGIHGARYGSLASHGKAAYVGMDPGKEALVGAWKALKLLRDQPEIPLGALDELEVIVQEEFDRLQGALKNGWQFSKSRNSLAIEMDYSAQWQDGQFGFPVFCLEDMYAGTLVLANTVMEMGVWPTIMIEGNIWTANGLGTVDEDGNLLEDRSRCAIRALMKAIEIIARQMRLV